MTTSTYLDAIRVQKFMLILTGIWPKKNAGVFYKIYGCTVSILMPLLLIVPCIFRVSFASDQIAEASYYLFSSLTIAFYFVKLGAFYMKTDALHETLDHLNAPAFQGHQDSFDVYIKKAVNVTVRIRKVLHYSCLVFMVLVGVFPVLDDTKLSRPLPFDLPIRTEGMSFRFYALLYALQVLTTVVSAYNNTNLDMVAYGLMALGAAQLEILGSKLRFLGVGEKRGKLRVDYGRLRNCVEHHSAIISFVRKIEESYVYVFLVQYINSLILIGATGFSFIVIPKHNIRFGAAVSYFTAAVMEVGLYCIFGDELMIQSTRVRDACYSSKWDDSEPEIRRCMLIIMERSKIPLVLTAGKFANISRQSLVTICKTSYSYFALLKQIYNRGK